MRCLGTITRVALQGIALSQPKHTHPACKEHDGQHRSIVHSESCLQKRLIDGPRVRVDPLEISDDTDDRDCRVNAHVLNCEADHTLERSGYRVDLGSSKNANLLRSCSDGAG